MQIGTYFEQKIQLNIYCHQADSLQKIFENIIIFMLIKVYIKFGCNNG